MSSQQRWEMLKQYVRIEYAKQPVKRFTINGLFIVKVNRIYDGDTFFGQLLLDSHVHEFSFRMLGYNSDEMRVSKTNPNRDHIKANALKSKEELGKFLPIGKYVYVKCDGFDKCVHLQ
jgi:hypothetical protein